MSCFEHTDNTCTRNGTKVQGVSFAQALWSWWSGAGTYDIHLVDDCNSRTGTLGPCNDWCIC
jgi:hypothetical protein